MKLGIICGSHRAPSQSRKVADYVNAQLLSLGVCDEVFLYDLGGNPLPMWDEGVWQQEERWQKHLAPLSKELHACDGFVVVSPEWHGMAPAGLKNFFLMWTTGGEIAHKPALIVTVSSADGGSYPVAELRMSSYKNSRIVYLPEHLIIRNVQTVFNTDGTENNESAQTYFHDRLGYCLRQLQQYALALRDVRASGVTSLETYTSGM